MRSIAVSEAEPMRADQRVVHSRSPVALDLIGAVLLALLALSILVSTADDGGSPGPPLILLGGACAVYALARLAGSRAAWLTPAIVLGAIGASVIPHFGDIVSRAPLSGPLGYANANGALIAQGAFASLLLAAVLTPRPARVVFASIAAALTIVAFASGAITAGIVVAALAPLAIAAAWAGIARWLGVGLAVMLAIAVGLTAFVGAAAASGRDVSLVRRVGDVVTARRVELWRDAWTLMVDHPVTGIGPGRFPEESPTSLADVDAHRAHEEFLQAGAEDGIPAALLLVLLFVWGIARPLVRSRGASAAIAAVAVGALGLHASIDYVLHYPAVPLACAALLGSAVALSVREVPRAVDAPA